MTATTLEPTLRVQRDSWTRLLYLQLAAFAFFLYAFGPALGFLKDDLHLSDSLAGLHSTAYAIGVTAGGAAAPWYIRRAGGSRPALWLGLVGLSAAVGLFCAGPALPVTLTAAAICGVFGSWLCIAVPAALANAHGPLTGPAAITEANAVAAFVGVAAPLAVGGAASIGLGWRTALLAVAPISGLLYLVLGRVREPERLIAWQEATLASEFADAAALIGPATESVADSAELIGPATASFTDSAELIGPATASFTDSPELIGPATASFTDPVELIGPAIASSSISAAQACAATAIPVASGVASSTEPTTSTVGCAVAEPSIPSIPSIPAPRAAGPQPAPPSAVPAAHLRDLPRRFWLNQLAGVCAGAVEFSLTLWCATLLHDRAHLAKSVAATGVTAVVLGMALGRAVGGRLALRFSIDRLIIGAFLTNLFGFAVFWLTANPVAMFAGLLVAGLGVSLQFPLISARGIALSGGRAELAGAINMFGAGIAIGVAPFALGFLSDRVGIHTAYLLVPLFIAAAVGAIAASRAPSESMAA